jgi:tetratricopeptide (TPR) repeat protein
LALLDIPDVSMDVAGAVLGVPPDEAADAAEYLADTSLVHWTRPGHVAYHDLLKLLAREQAHHEDDEHTRQAVVAAALRSCLSSVVAAVRTFRPGSPRVAVAIDPAWPVGRRFDDPTSAQAWLDAERANLTALAVQAAAVDDEAELAATLCSALFPFMDMHAYWAELVPALRAVVEAGRRSGRRNAEAGALSDIGWAFHRLGRNRDAERCLSEGIDVARRIGDRRGEASCLNVMGVLNKSMGRAHEAIDYFSRCLTLRRDLGARSEEATTLTNLGNQYSYLSRHEEAIVCHEQAMSISQSLGDDRGVAISLVNVGDNLVDMGRLDEGRAVLEKAIRMCDVTQEKMLRATALTILARARRQQREYRQAASLAQTALTDYTAVNYPRGRADALRELGGAMADLGQDADARLLLEESLHLYTQLEAPEAARVQQELITIHHAG